jgi:hypothetical protein
MHYGITVDALGRIYVNGGVIDHSSFINRMSVTRFLANGMSDNSFGDSGIMLSDPKDFGYDHVVNEAFALNYGSNGAYPIITAGYKGNESYFTSFLAAAYTEAGALDTLPNTSNGYMDTLFYKKASEAAYAVLAYDGYAYFAGVGGAQNETDFMLVKFALPAPAKVNALPAQPVIYLTANPNPAHDFINAKYELAEDASVQFRLVAVNSGAVYPLQQQSLKKGNYQTKLLINKVPKGIYALQLVTARGQASVKLWIE